MINILCQRFMTVSISPNHISITNKYAHILRYEKQLVNETQRTNRATAWQLTAQTVALFYSPFRRKRDIYALLRAILLFLSPAARRSAE